MTTYSELLKHPKWQKKRLEILERDGWKCRHCDSAEITLHVHHKWYGQGKKPWEYPADALIALCEACHKKEETELRLWTVELIQVLKFRGFMAKDFEELWAEHTMEAIEKLAKAHNG